MRAVLFLALLALSACCLSAALRAFALRRRWLDHPNARSSHSFPTPRGGGLGFALPCALGLFWLYAQGLLEARELAALQLGLPIALLGLLDDLRNLTIRTRILTQAVLALLAVLLLGGLPAQPLPGGELSLGWLGVPLAALALVWLVNLYNFMDGIDALAAGEALFVTLAAASFAWRSGEGGQALLLLSLGAAVAGFLFWNLPPARLFMGDAGSNYLGLMLGTLGLLSLHAGYMHLWSWLILLGVFVVDSTQTLLTRAAGGEVWYHAHRSHAYQQAASRWGHGKVDGAITLLNLLWLFPLAWISLIHAGWGLPLTLLAYAPLALLAFGLQAGKRPRSPGHVSMAGAREGK